MSLCQFDWMNSIASLTDSPEAGTGSIWKIKKQNFADVRPQTSFDKVLRPSVDAVHVYWPEFCRLACRILKA